MLVVMRTLVVTASLAKERLNDHLTIKTVLVQACKRLYPMLEDPVVFARRSESTQPDFGVPDKNRWILMSMIIPMN